MLTKYADAEIVEITPLEAGDLKKVASFEHLPEDTFRTNDGYMYVKVRAISSRVNKNNDGWPVQELAGMNEGDFRGLVSKLDAEDSVTLSSEKLGRVLTANNIETRGEYGFKTFSGRPIFVDHNNTDPRRARGVIVDSLLYVEPSAKKYASDSYWSASPSNHSPETWIELLLEVDAKSFPKLAKEIKEGKVNAVSMGCNVDFTKCSVCGNEAATTHDYCDHVKRKGVKHIDKEGNTKIAYEDCYGVNFFEISFVFDPADVTALTTGPIIAKTANDSMYWDNNDQQASKIDPTSGDKDWLKGLGIGWDSNASDDAYNRARVYGQKYAESVKAQLQQDPNLKYTLPVDDPEFFDMMKDEVKAGPETDDSKLREFFLQGFKGSMGDAPETDPLEMQFNTSPDQSDHDWMMDNGMKWASEYESQSKEEYLIERIKKDALEFSFEAADEGPEGLLVQNPQSASFSYIQEFIHNTFKNIEFDNKFKTDLQFQNEVIQAWNDGIKEGFSQMQSDDMQTHFESSPSFEDHDFLNDMGVKWAKTAGMEEQVLQQIDSVSSQLVKKQAQEYKMLELSYPNPDQWQNMDKLDPTNPQDIDFITQIIVSGYTDLSPELQRQGPKLNMALVNSPLLGKYGAKWIQLWNKEMEQSSSASQGFNTKDVNWLNQTGIQAKTADTIAPSKIDTLRKEAECPFDIKQCGMDESGQCDVCGYNKPPDGFGDPDIERSKEVQKKIDKVRENEDFNQPGVAIKIDEDDSAPAQNVSERLRNMRKILTNAQIRQINVQTKEIESEAMNKESEIILTASVEETPSDEKLQSLGWVVDATPEVPAAEDGKKATDDPRGQRVVDDQLAPVEAAKKEAMGESQLMTGEGDQTPQYQNFGTKPIKEHKPGSDPKAPKPTHSDGTQTKAEERPQFSGPGGNFPTEDIKEHQPGAPTENSYPTPGTGPNGGNGAEGAPQFTTEDTGGKFLDQDGIAEHHPSGIPSNPPESKSSAHLFNSMKLAELEIELGLINGETKYARVAELESSSESDVVTRLNALSSVKEAGLKKHVEPVVAKTSIPSFRSTGAAASEVLPDEAIFA